MHAHTRTHARTCTHTNTHTCTQTHTHAHSITHTHTHAHAHTHTYTHTHTQEELLQSCDDIRTAAEVMHRAGSEFAQDTLEAKKRSVMVSAAQELLICVTRLMVIADIVDVSMLLKASRRVSE